jgi:hypothetical protein
VPAVGPTNYGIPAAGGATGYGMMQSSPYGSLPYNTAPHTAGAGLHQGPLGAHPGMLMQQQQPHSQHMSYQQQPYMQPYPQQQQSQLGYGASPVTPPQVAPPFLAAAADGQGTWCGPSSRMDAFV